MVMDDACGSDIVGVEHQNTQEDNKADMLY